jgi:hypothetical protein
VVAIRTTEGRVLKPVPQSFHCLLRFDEDAGRPVPPAKCSILIFMKRILATAALLAVLLSFSNLYATEKQFETGRIVTVEKKFHERVLYYLVNTPVTQDDPYYEVSLQLGNTVLLTEFTPRHAADDLPEGWIDNAEVQVKITDKHHVSVRQADGMELQLLILKRMPGTGPSTAPTPAPVKN